MGDALLSLDTLAHIADARLADPRTRRLAAWSEQPPPGRGKEPFLPAETFKNLAYRQIDTADLDRSRGPSGREVVHRQKYARPSTTWATGTTSRTRRTTCCGDGANSGTSPRWCARAARGSPGSSSSTPPCCSPGGSARGGRGRGLPRRGRGGHGSASRLRFRAAPGRRPHRPPLGGPACPGGKLPGGDRRQPRVARRALLAHARPVQRPLLGGAAPHPRPPPGAGPVDPGRLLRERPLPNGPPGDPDPGRLPPARAAPVARPVDGGGPLAHRRGEGKPWLWPLRGGEARYAGLACSSCYGWPHRRPGTEHPRPRLSAAPGGGRPGRRRAATGRSASGGGLVGRRLRGRPPDPVRWRWERRWRPGRGRLFSRPPWPSPGARAFSPGPPVGCGVRGPPGLVYIGWALAACSPSPPPRRPASIGWPASTTPRLYVQHALLDMARRLDAHPGARNTPRGHPLGTPWAGRPLRFFYGGDLVGTPWRATRPAACRGAPARPRSGPERALVPLYNAYSIRLRGLGAGSAADGKKAVSAGRTQDGSARCLGFQRHAERNRLRTGQHVRGLAGDLSFWPLLGLLLVAVLVALLLHRLARRLFLLDFKDPETVSLLELAEGPIGATSS